MYDYGRDISISIFDESHVNFDATGYTATVKILNKNYIAILSDIAVTWDAIATGKGHFAFTESLRFSSSGIGFAVVQLTKSGEITSTFPVQVDISST